MPDVNPRLVSAALTEVNGHDFERFVQDFYPAASGIDLIPLGGVGDGGADGFQDLRDDGVFEGKRHATFFQISIQADHRSKIRNTIKRLIEFGRAPRSLTYITSRLIPHLDVEAEELSEELDVFIRIRDRRFIESRINADRQTVAAFNHYLAGYLNYIVQPGGTHILPGGANQGSTSVFVFLQQELERRGGNSSLHDSVSDSLILWALEGTDPDQDKFMTRDEIVNHVEATIPVARHFLRASIDHRLSILSSKENPSGREIRFHKKEDAYCLPYETRQAVQEENEKDEALRAAVFDKFVERAADELAEGDNQVCAEGIAKVAVRAIQLTFEKEGMEFAAFLNTDNVGNDAPSIAENVETAIDEIGICGNDAVVTKVVALRVLRGAFYGSTKEERLYFGKLCKTYSLLFSLSANPDIINYFQTMASNFYLVVGAELLVRALSERYLAEEDQMTSNLFKILSEAGSKVVLTEPVLDEVYSHICNSDREFKNYFSAVETHIGTDISSYSSMILIRAYFYAKHGENTEGSKPRSWGQYISGFCDYSDLYNAIGREQVRTYLMTKFGLSYEEKADLTDITDDEEVEELHKKLKPHKKKDVLAYNDALMIHYIYARRRKLKEKGVANKYGYRTWWLTHETDVKRYTKDLVASKGGQYIMRPEFVLNFVALAPSTAEVRATYGSVFPSLLGIRLSDRVKDDVFHSMMKSVNEASEYDDARVESKTREMANKLMADMVKKYDHQLASSPLDDPF